MLKLNESLNTSDKELFSRSRSMLTPTASNIEYFQALSLCHQVALGAAEASMQ